MAQIVYLDSVGTGPRFTVANFADLVVVAGVTVASTDDVAIHVAGGGSDLMVFGQLFGQSTGISLGDQAGLGNNLLVGADGIVSGQSYGVSVYNAGSHLANAGQIMSASVGVVVSTNQGGAVQITNSGTIFGDYDGIFASFAPGGVVLTNTGTISTVGGKAYFASSDSTFVDTIHNHGAMIGDVWLAGGSDLYDGRGGMVDGTVYGEGDDDRFIAGLSAEVFDGGAGNDLLDFTTSTKVTVSLDTAVQGTRGAEGDTYLNIENLTGSRNGGDKLYGSAADNHLTGLGGADLLSGGAGNDLLTGGADKDVLIGGVGNDTFLFNALSEAGDGIRDFGQVVGNNDTIWIGAAGFGGGLVAGAVAANQFQVGTDTVALSASVRFIFDTADTTLWFDANGKAAGGLTMIADLQNGAVVGLSDLWLF